MSESVRGAYDRWAESYDRVQNATRDLDASVVRSAGLAIEGAEVLELGAGTGKNTVWLARHARRVCAVDFSEQMLARARARVPASHVEFVRHDVQEAWPLESHSFDVVIGNLVLEHVERLVPIYESAARVLRTGGTLFLCELHPYRQMRGGQAHFTDERTGQTVRVDAHVHSISEYVNAGIAAGFTLIAIGEHLEDDAAAEAPPRLISLNFRR
jgi:ubiquinone/menaquinone biosynthesis C-methylase UbiE